MTTDNNPPAFPINRSYFTQDGRLTSSDWLPGMSLRDWFAGQALCGFLAWSPNNGDQTDPDVAAERAYQYADAMLKRRML